MIIAVQISLCTCCFKVNAFQLYATEHSVEHCEKRNLKYIEITELQNYDIIL